MNTTKHIALYFGSFNPVHTGHLIIANHVLEHCAIDELWLIVSPQNPLKPAAGLLNEYNRLHLANLATADNERIKPSSIEFGLPKPSYTIDTLTYLSEKHPQHQFHVLMGGDSLQNLPRWKNYELLLQRYPLIVYLRPGFEAPAFPPHIQPTIDFLQAPLLDISATFIRQQIQAGKSIQYLVHDDVREEILKAGYYRDSK